MNYAAELQNTSTESTTFTRPEVRFARSEDEKQAIFRFRYKVYVEGMGRDKNTADHINETLSDSLDESATLIGAFLGDVAVGAGRVNYSSDCTLPEEELYGFSEYEKKYPNGLSLTSKVMVDPEFRGTKIFLDIARLCLIDAGPKKIRGNFIATADKLVPLFKKIGFVQYRPRVDSYLDYGSSNPMMMDPNDIGHLESVNSPLLDLAKRYYVRPTVQFDSEPKNFNPFHAMAFAR